MTEETQTKSIMPHIVLSVAVIVIIIVGYMSFSSNDEPQVTEVPVSVPDPVVPEPNLEPVVVEQPSTDDEYATQEEALNNEPAMVELAEPEPQPEPLDTSDGTVKTQLLSLANYEAAAKLLVNDDLLQRFVVFTENIANKAIATNHQVVMPPEEAFRTYEQSGKTYIDAASFKRYTPYVDTLTSMDTDGLIVMFDTYKPALQDIFAEIGDPSDNFKFVMVDAINHLLDTPEVPVPIEVHTESVMFKFKDERLENLSGPQKQLLRTGPENMRRIKAKLRDIKEALQ